MLSPLEGIDARVSRARKGKIFKMTIKKSLTFKILGETRTQALAISLAKLIKNGEQIALKGDLGTGKTLFARAFIQALCGLDTEVPSPTFTLLQTYRTEDGREIFHFDLYRIENSEEVFELNIDDAFADGISLIEWPERLGSLLPDDHLELTLSYGTVESHRHVIIAAGDNWSERLKEISI